MIEKAVWTSICMHYHHLTHMTLILRSGRWRQREQITVETVLQAQHIVVLLQYTSCFITVFLGGQLHQC